jgi:hypothetical protein
LESDDDALAQQLSKQLGVAVVRWTIQTESGLIWIRCFQGQNVVRELSYADGRWSKHGEPQPFEHASLSKWLAKRDLSPSPDGYDVFDCFLGIAHPPREPLVIQEEGGNQRFYLSVPLAVEARELAARRGVTLSTLLQTAWELGKHAILSDPEASPVAPPTLGSAAPMAALCFAEAPVAPLPEAVEKADCLLTMPETMLRELRSVAMSLDRSLSWSLGEAYLLARPRLGLTVSHSRPRVP